MLITIAAVVGSLTGTGCATPSQTEDPDSTPSTRAVAAVVLTPRIVSLDSGQSHQFLASALDADGEVIDDVSISWESLDTVAADVTGEGLVTAKRTGSAKVRGSAHGRGDTAVVTVTSPAPPTPPSPAPPSMATVVFSDDFESGTLSAWNDGVNASKHRVVTDASRAAGGSRFLEITYPAGGDGGWLTRFFMPGYDSLRVSYDVQFDAGWVGGTKLLNLRGSRTDNQWSSFGQAGKCPDGSQWFATNVVMLATENPGPIRFYSYFPGMPKENDGITCWGRHDGMGTVSYASAAPIARGAWHRVDVFVRLNTPGQNNGLQRMWVDGQLRGEWTGLVLRTTTLLRLNSLTLEGSLMGGTQGNARVLRVDNVLVTR